jgi:protein-disulfide isomerase
MSNIGTIGLSLIWLTTAVMIVVAVYQIFSSKVTVAVGARTAAPAVLIMALAVVVSLGSGSSIDSEVVFDKVKIIEPTMTANQVRQTDIHPDLFEIYSEGRMRYVLGEDHVIRGEVFNLNTGENVTQAKVSAYQAIAGTSFGGNSSLANRSIDVGASKREAQVQQLPEPQAPAPEPEVVDETRDQLSEAPGLNAALAILANDIIPDEMTVVYPAIGEEKHQVTIFSDITCPVCQKNHLDYPAFQERGVTLRAALFPRQGMDAAEAEVMSKVLCAGDMAERRSLLDRAYEGDTLGEVAMCDNGYLKNIRDIAISTDSGLSVNSTPTLMSANGVRIDGYPRENPVETVMALLERR